MPDLRPCYQRSVRRALLERDVRLAYVFDDPIEVGRTVASGYRSRGTYPGRVAMMIQRRVAWDGRGGAGRGWAGGGGDLVARRHTFGAMHPWMEGRPSRDGPLLAWDAILLARRPASQVRRMSPEARNNALEARSVTFVAWRRPFQAWRRPFQARRNTFLARRIVFPAQSLRWNSGDRASRAGNRVDGTGSRLALGVEGSGIGVWRSAFVIRHS